MIQVTFDLEWSFEDAVTGEYLTTFDPTFRVSFIVDITDGGDKQADNINLKVYNVEAITPTHHFFPHSDADLFISMMN